MRLSFRLLLTVSAVSLIVLSGCSRPLEWPESPLVSFPESDPDWRQPETREAAMEAIEGHYAHFDIVAYEDVSTRTPMRTLIVSYGFTDFRIEDGRLLQIDRFCHAEQMINQPNVQVTFSDEATQAIKPRVQEVDVRFENGSWLVYRPASPTLLGITGDPSRPLSTDPEDPNLTDPDGDGNPGVTVRLRMGNLLDGAIYITRREIYTDYLTLNSDGNLYGHVEDASEQFVVGASHRILRQQSNPVQIPDPGMNPIVLIRIDEDLDTCEELKTIGDEIFPTAPSFR